MGCGASKDGLGGVASGAGGAGAPDRLGNGSVSGDYGSDRGSAGGDLRYNMLKANKGDRFNELYELQDGELGTAAMGCVVRAAHKKRTGEMFACKTFMVSSVPKKKAQKRILETLRNEIDLLRSLDHPNIVRAYESYEVGRDLHLVMELCNGGDLNARSYTEPQAAEVVKQILSAIRHAHDRGICHRDLKFENILWESKAPDAQIKLIDFGMSARFQEGMPMNERVGTVYTMAPEVLQGEYTKQADLWSVGCITFHLISGEPPFECENEVDTMRRLLAVSYFWPMGSTVSSEAKAFVYNLLKFDPRRRWTVQGAIASPWLKRFAPGGVSPRNSSKVSTSSTAVLPSPSVSLRPAFAGVGGGSGTVGSSEAAELLPVGGSSVSVGESTASRVGVDGVDGEKDAPLPLPQQLGGEEETAGEGDEFREPSIKVRMLSSMRDYRSYGALRRTALMVVAYNHKPERLRELRDEFAEFDTESNGKISRNEMQAALAQRGVAHEEIEELFKSLDLDRSGDIHYLEFLAATIEAVGSMEEDRLRLAFERLDADESGFITVANLKEIVGPSYDDEAIRKTLQEADAGKDGRVGWDEFLVLMRDRSCVDNLVAAELKSTC